MKELLTVYQTAVRFDVSPVTVYKWIEKGLKAKKETISGTRTRQMINVDDVTDFIMEAKK
jgi:hypothetical protein